MNPVNSHQKRKAATATIAIATAKATVADSSNSSNSTAQNRNRPPTIVAKGEWERATEKLARWYKNKRDWHTQQTTPKICMCSFHSFIHYPSCFFIISNFSSEENEKLENKQQPKEFFPLKSFICTVIAKNKWEE